MRRAASAAGIAALAFAAFTARPAAAGWWDEAARAQDATLDEVRRSPERWLGVTANLVLRFVRTTGVPSSLRDGTFAERGFVAVGVAPGSPRFDRFVVREGSAEAARVRTLLEGEEIRVRAVLRLGDDGLHVLDVVWVAGASDALTPEELADVARADELLAKDNGAAAETLYRGVLVARTLAPEIRADLLVRVGRSLRAQSRLEAAAETFREALRLHPLRATDAALAAVEDDLRAAAALRARLAPPVGAPDAAPLANVARVPSLPGAGPRAGDLPPPGPAAPSPVATTLPAPAPAATHPSPATDPAAARTAVPVPPAPVAPPLRLAGPKDDPRAAASAAPVPPSLPAAAAPRPAPARSAAPPAPAPVASAPPVSAAPSAPAVETPPPPPVPAPRLAQPK